MPSSETVLDLPAKASELYLAASWSRARGDYRQAGRLFLEAATVWKDAALAAEGYSPEQAIRQRINQVVTLFESGSIPAGQRERLELDQAMARAALSDELREALRSEWESIRRQRIDRLMAGWDQDWESLRSEVGTESLNGVSTVTAQRWMVKYPGYPGAHYMGYVAADREGRFVDARQHLEDAVLFDPHNPRMASLLLTLLVKAEEQPSRALSTATAVYDRFRNQSAKICYLFATTLIWISEQMARPSADILERAAAAASLAVEMTPNDLGPKEWAWANVLVQYCHWRLARPGVPRPQGRYDFWWGYESVVVEVPFLGGSGSASRLVEATREIA